ncbi:response regulator [Pontibacter chitinilyticus]|uniref:response regulator n=1 Tax=Pontibacter chitinilyticus TaxID=2674989 RepID=UPI00321AABB4
MKIFLIDDDSLSLFLTQRLLMLEGFKDIRTFLSAEEALEFLASSSVEEIPDVVLLDLNMPGMSGWEFLDALPPLDSKLRGKFSLYILTSSLDVSDTAKSQEYSIVSGLIHKPITPEDIKMIAQQVSEGPHPNLKTAQK